jgi:VIT1/CCC1 family predicted Fe2+/Mn2+ transporter
MVMNELGPAMRVSNAIAVSMLFVLGYAFAKVAEYRPLLTGVLMVVLGSAVVAATIALGG